MDRFVVMVDAGYLLAKSIEIVSGRASRERRDLVINDPARLIELLATQALTTFGLRGRELLRVYWYDGMLPSGLTSQQRTICDLPDVNFRAGLVNSKGQQKGVDSLIVTDLLELATNHAVTEAALVTGDSDLAIGIELAQKKGVRIAVLGIEDLAVGVSHGQSREITSRADRVGRIGSAELRPVMRFVPRAPVVPRGPTSVPPAATRKGKPGATTAAASAASPVSLTAPQKAAIETAVKAFIASNSPPPTVIDPSTKRIDAAVDRSLLFHVFTALGHGQLTPQNGYMLGHALEPS